MVVAAKAPNALLRAAAWPDCGAGPDCGRAGLRGVVAG